MPLAGRQNGRTGRQQGRHDAAFALLIRRKRYVVNLVLRWQLSIVGGRGGETEKAAGSPPAVQVSHICRYAASRSRANRPISKCGMADWFQASLCRNSVSRPGSVGSRSARTGHPPDIGLAATGQHRQAGPQGIAGGGPALRARCRETGRPDQGARDISALALALPNEPLSGDAAAHRLAPEVVFDRGVCGERAIARSPARRSASASRYREKWGNLVARIEAAEDKALFRQAALDPRRRSLGNLLL